MLPVCKIFVLLLFNKIVELHGIKNTKLDLFPLPPLESSPSSFGAIASKLGGLAIGTSAGILAFRRFRLYKWTGNWGKQRVQDNSVNISAVVTELKMEIQRLKAELIVVQDRNNKSIVDSVKKTNEIAALRIHQEETEKQLKTIITKVSKIQRDSRAEVGMLRNEVKSLVESLGSETKNADIAHVALRRELDDLKKETVAIISQQNDFFVNKIKNYTDSLCDIISESV
jgi:hypothetical protein